MLTVMDDAWLRGGANISLSQSNHSWVNWELGKKENGFAQEDAKIRSEIKVHSWSMCLNIKSEVKGVDYKMMGWRWERGEGEGGKELCRSRTCDKRWKGMMCGSRGLFMSRRSNLKRSSLSLSLSLSLLLTISLDKIYSQVIISHNSMWEYYGFGIWRLGLN